MDRNSDSSISREAIDALVADILASPGKLQHLQGVALPNRERAVRIIELLDRKSVV